MENRLDEKGIIYDLLQSSEMVRYTRRYALFTYGRWVIS